jgi:serine kinase of HPr protein (carbohydrate metabolism regulator)
MVASYIHKDVAFKVSVTEIENSNLQLTIFNALKDVFKGFSIVESDHVAMEFTFTDNIEKFIKDTEFVRVKDIKVGNNQTHFKDNELNFLIDNSNPFKVTVNVVDNETFKSSLRIFNKAYKTNIELQITTFYYRIFLLFSQLWNLENNCSYIHSSAVEVNGRSILFTADSGVGKSALLLQLSQDKDFKFIADDLTIISDKSESYFQGRCLSVKPYHLKYYSFLAEKLKKLMSSTQRLQWRIINDNRQTYRITPTELFDNICEKSQIKRIVHLCNHSKDIFEIKDISSDDLIASTIPILTNELFLANYKLDTVSSLPNSPFQSTDKMYAATKNIFSQAFNDVDIKLILVPYHSNPIDLFNFLKQEGCLN